MQAKIKWPEIIAWLGILLVNEGPNNIKFRIHLEKIDMWRELEWTGFI